MRGARQEVIGRGCREDGAEGSHVSMLSTMETQSVLEASCAVVQSQFLESCRAGSQKTWGAGGGRLSMRMVERLNGEG